MKSKVRKALSIAQLSILLAGFTGGTVNAMLSNPVQAQAAKKSKSNSSSTDSGIAKIEKALSSQNNIMNSNFPSAAQQAAIQGPLTYDKKVQLITTYAYLMDKYGSGDNYSKLYKNGADVISAFKKVAPDVSFSKIGNDQFIQSVSKTTSKTDQSTKSSKAEKIATSSYSTDMSLSSKKTWMNKNTLGKLALKVAGPLANNAVQAISISDSRNPISVESAYGGKNDGDTFLSSAGHGTSDALHATGDALTQFGNWVKDSVTGGDSQKETYQGLWAGHYITKGSTQDFKEMQEQFGSQNHSSITRNGMLRNLIGNSSYVNGKKNDLKYTIAIGIMDSLATNTKDVAGIKDKSDLQKYLNKMTAAKYGSVDSSTGSGASQWATILNGITKTAPVYSDTTQSIGYILGDKHMSQKSASEAVKKITPGILPAQVKAVGTSNLGVYGQNYSKYINAHANASVTDDDYKTFAAFQAKNASLLGAASNATAGNQLLSWSPIYPYSKSFKTDKNKQVNEQAEDQGSANGNGFKTDGNGPVVMRVQYFFNSDTKNPLYTANGSAPRMALGANASDVVDSGKESVYNYSAISITQDGNADKRGFFSKAYAKAYKAGNVGNLKPSNDIVGYDSYGNIINGENSTIIVPYWQNNTIAGIADSPYMKTNSHDFGLGSGATGESSVNDAAISAIVGKGDSFKLAQKVRNALNSKSASSTQAKENAAINEAVGASGGGTLSSKGAAAVAILITAKDANAVQAFNKLFISKAVDAKQLYVGKSDAVANADKNKTQGTSLYTATDIIQRTGLEFDYGDFLQLRKTIVTMIASTYDDEFLRDKTQNIFNTNTFGSDGEFIRYGLTPYYIAMIVIVAIEMWTMLQYFRGQVRPSAYLTRAAKFLVVILCMVAIHDVEEWMLNKPVDWAIQTPLKQQSVVDQWSKLKQEKDIKNIFYSSLMSDKSSQINNSNDYQIPFYTSTMNNGEFDSSVSDPMANINQQKSKMTGSASLTGITQSTAYKGGNGAVPLTAPWQYKTVNVTLADLTNWASHMTRQLYSSQNKPGFQKGAANYEAPSQGYAPGKEPLFAWLANDYQPIGNNGQDNSDGSGGANAKAYDASDDGDKDYGSRRNPADTSIKSAYNGGTTGNEVNNKDMYKNFNNYTEFAVNTKHYANKRDIAYGVDQNSSGGVLTASQAFLKIWQSIFENSGAGGDPGDANSLNSLMNFAQALNGNMGGQVTSSAVGQDNTGNGLTSKNVGQVGRNDLLNELSMTKHQRQLLNGNNGGFSKAAKDMIDTYQIPAGKSDYFNFDSKGSIVRVMRPYVMKDVDSRDATVYKINKALLNDYVSIYSIVRAQIQPSDANSSDDSGNNQTDPSNVDPFTMAEDQVMAVDAFFRINQVLGYRMFPTGYKANSISLDTWNRILFVPVGVMNQLSSDDQYNQDSLTESSPVTARDNVVEYLSLNTGIFSLIAFIIMNYMLLLFGILYTCVFKFVLPLVIIIAVIRNFLKAKSNTSSFVGLLKGSLGLVGVFAVLKFGLVELISYLSRTMNNNYIAAGGYSNLPVGSHSMAVIAYLIFATIFLIKIYFPFMSSDIFTFGVGANGGFFRGLGGQIKSTWIDNPFSKFKNGKIAQAWAKRRENQTEGNLKNKIGRKTASIRDILHATRHPINTIMRAIKDRKMMSSLSGGNPYFKRDTDSLFGRLSDIKNSKYGGINATDSQGLDLNELRSKNLTNGDLIDTISKGKASYALGSAEMGRVLGSIISENGIKGVAVDGDRLVFDGANSTMLNTAGGRKELFDNLMMSAAKTYDKYKGLGTGEVSNAPKGMIGVQRNGQEMALPVDELSGLDPSKTDDLLKSSFIKKNFDVISSPVVGADGKYANGTLKLRAKDGLDTSSLVDRLETNAAHFTGNKFSQRYTGMANLGSKVDESMLKDMPQGMSFSNGRLFFDRNDATQREYAQNIADQIGGVNNKFVNNISRFVDAGSDYVANGAGHGLQQPAFTSTGLRDFTTQRFATNNNASLANGLQGLSNIASHPNVTRQAAEAQQKFNDALLNQYGSPRNLLDAYAQAANKNHMKFSQDTNNVLKNLNGALNNLGPVDYKNLSKQQQASIGRLMNKLNSSLENSNQLNVLQNSVSSGLNLPEARQLANTRQELLKLSKVSDPNIFNKMTVGQIGAGSAQAVSMKNISIDKNGILTGDVPTALSNGQGQQRISTLIRGLTE